MDCVSDGTFARGFTGLITVDCLRKEVDEGSVERFHLGDGKHSCIHIKCKSCVRVCVEEVENESVT